MYGTSLSLPQLIAQALLQIDAVGFAPSQPITFKSGIVSPVYVDNRRLPYHPGQWHSVIQGFRTLIEEHEIHLEVIAGVAVGGVPHSAALSYVLRVPSVFVRKESKEHGTHKLIEGGEVAQQRVVLVEDMITTGGSSLAGVHALRNAGAVVEDVLSIVSYGFDEAQQAFQHAQVRVHTLTDFSVILQEALQMGKFDSAAATIIQDWFDEPYGWAQRHGF
jgi:orotate phosphoribosyltransferase